MINFRTGTHNPLTLYVTSEPYGPHQGRDLPGWMRDGEWSIGWLPHEGLAALAVEAWNAFVCQACPWGCPSCSLNRAICECYEHQDNIDEDGRPVAGSTPRQDAEQVATPPRCVHQIYTGSGWCVRCQLKVGHEAPHTNGMMSWLHNDPRRIEDAPGSTPLDSPTPARPRGLDSLLGYVADRLTPADAPAPVPPPVDALEEILKLAERLAVHRSDAARDADRDRASAQQHHERAASVRLLIAIRVEDVRAAGVEEGRRQQATKVEELQLLLEHAEQYARDLQDNGDVPGRAEILTEAYWKLRDHASALRSTEVYRKASERKEGTLHESPAFQRYRWLEATARGIEDGAHDLAEMLGVEQHEIERPAADHG